jgi:Na+-driven multidrug efflux pump
MLYYLAWAWAIGFVFTLLLFWAAIRLNREYVRSDSYYELFLTCIGWAIIWPFPIGLIIYGKFDHYDFINWRK